MSQSKSEPFQITAVVTIDDAGEPQAVTVENIGQLPKSAVRAIADEAIDRLFGDEDHPFLTKINGEIIGENSIVFEVRKFGV